MPHRPPVAAARRLPESTKSGATFPVAMTLGVVGLMLCAAPPLAGWQRAWFAQRLARHAETAGGGVAQLEVRQLAERGLEALPALVRLAGSSNPAAATAARDAVENLIAAWLVEYRTSADAANFTQRVAAAASALATNIDGFDAARRAWARRIALELAPQADRLPAGVAAGILADCERVLDAAPNPPASIAALARATETPDAAMASPAAPPWQRFGHEPPVAQPSPRVGQPLALAPDAVSSPNDAPQGELAIVPPLDAAPAREDETTLMPTNPVTPTAPVAGAPPAALEFSPPRTGAKPLPPPSAPAAVVDVPSPQRQRAMLRRYRQMSDRELTAELAKADPHAALMIEQTLRERRALVTARGPGVAPPATSDAAVQAPSELADRISRLPAPEARRVLRQLVTDAAGDADARLEALTLLATTGDPELAAIARQRALEDADPRVADLALKILRSAEKVR